MMSNPIERKASGLPLGWVLLVANGWGFRTSGIYHKLGRKRWRPSALLANSILLRQVCGLRNVPPSECHKSLRGLLSSHIQLQACRGNVDMERKLLLYSIPYIKMNLVTLTFSFLAFTTLVGRVPSSMYFMISVIHELLMSMGFISSPL